MAKATSKPAVPNSQPDITDVIRARAYELYEQRGRIDGNDLEDWLQAEAEIREFHASKAAA